MMRRGRGRGASDVAMQQLSLWRASSRSAERWAVASRCETRTRARSRKAHVTWRV